MPPSSPLRRACLLLLAACLAGCWSAQAAATSKKCTVVPPGAKVPAGGVAGWIPKPATFANAKSLAFVGGELFEADPFYTKQKCPPHTGNGQADIETVSVKDVCTKVSTATKSTLYRVRAVVGYPCKGRKASTLKTKNGSYACPKDRFCTELYVTADAPFSFDFAAFNGAASGGDGDGDNYGEVLTNILDLKMKVSRFT